MFSFTYLVLHCIQIQKVCNRVKFTALSILNHATKIFLLDKLIGLLILQGRRVGVMNYSFVTRLVFLSYKLATLNCFSFSRSFWMILVDYFVFKGGG